MSYRFCDCLLASSHRTCMFSLRLLMMDGETVRNMYRALLQNKMNSRYCASGWSYYRNIWYCLLNFKILMCLFHEVSLNPKGCSAEPRLGNSTLTLRLLMSYIYIYMEHLFLMFLDHTQRRSTVGRTPLDE